MDNQDFNELVRVFQHTSNLPHLPESALRLIEVLDHEDPSCADLEKVIVADPALAACVIRAASSALYAGLGNPPTTVACAIMRLGLRSVRTLALTFAMQGLMSRSAECRYYDPTAFSRHCVYVAIAGQYLLTQREEGGAAWNAEEMFSAGLLHDLSVCLFALVSPELFDKTWERAREGGNRLDQQFFLDFGEPVALLGCAATIAWRLPPLFAEAMAAVADPAADDSKSVCMECLSAADGLAYGQGFALEPWVSGSLESAFVTEAELAAITATAQEYCDTFVAAAA